jgi:hypothetical protein
MINQNYYITLDGQLADLAAGQSITLQRYNPIFDFETVRGSKVLDFTLPFSAVNDRIFGYFGEHQTSYQNKKYVCEKYVDAVLIEKGYVELADVTEAGYVVFFTQNLGEIFGDYQHTTLNKIDFGKLPLIFKADFDPLVDAFAMPIVLNKAFYGVNVKAGFNGIVNEYTSTTSTSSVAVANGGYTADCPKVPMFSLKWLFEKIAILCDFKFGGGFFESEWFQYALLENTFSLDGSTEINCQNHLPEWSIPTFLKELKKMFNLALCFDSTNRTLVIRFADEVMQQATRLNFTEKIVPSANRKPEFFNRLEFDWELDKDDNLMKIPPISFEKYASTASSTSTGSATAATAATVHRGNFFTIKTGFSTRMTDDVSGLAIAEQVGVSPLFNQLSAKSSPKILLWNGMINGKPIATNARGGFRLALHGADGLVANCYNEYEKWRSKTASRSVQANLTAADLAELDFHRNACNEVAIHIHGKDYYIESLRVNLPLVGYTTMDLWER